MCLFEKAVQKPEGRLIECKVKDLVNERGEWEYIFLKDYLAEQDMLSLQTTTVPSPSSGDDIIRWKGSNTSNYCVSDMYKRMRGIGSEGSDSCWRKIWKWAGPRRVQVHLWLSLHDRLLTSSRRARLLGGSPICGRCRGDEENLLHAIRDCGKAKAI